MLRAPQDIERFKVVDPACDGLLGVYLFYKGVHAVACARVANHYWVERGETGRLIARLLQVGAMNGRADSHRLHVHAYTFGWPPRVLLAS